MDKGFRVFAVDDDPVTREMVAVVLADDCTVRTFDGAETCRATIDGAPPDLFLLDVTMPGVDGYTFCRQLKDDFATQDVPVVFVSASDDIESRIAAYDAGAEDYIVKPFAPEELHKKILVARRLAEDKARLREQAGYAQRTALSAMTSMGELGVVLQFLSKSFACGDLAEMGGAVLEALRQYDLQGAVQMRIAGRTLSLSQNGCDVPLETGILNHVRDAGRIFQFRTRCVFNYGRVTLMVNNLPLDDPDKVGRIRDNVAILAEGADARLRAIEVEQENHRREQGVLAALPQVHHALEALQENYRRTSFELTERMIEFQEGLIKSFVHLGLTETQEEFLNRLANNNMQRIIETQDQNLGIVAQLEAVARNLGGLVRS